MINDEYIEEKLRNVEKSIRKELEEMLINDPNSFYHIHGYDFTKKLSVERELLEKEILK